MVEGVEEVEAEEVEMEAVEEEGVTLVVDIVDVVEGGFLEKFLDLYSYIKYE